MLGLNALFKHSHDPWLTLNIQVLTTADVTFELLVDKGRSEAASPGYTPTATGCSTMATGYRGQMSPLPAAGRANLPPDSQEARVHSEVFASSLPISPPKPCSIKHLAPCRVISFTLAEYSNLSINAQNTDNPFNHPYMQLIQQMSCDAHTETK